MLALLKPLQELSVFGHYAEKPVNEAHERGDLGVAIRVLSPRPPHLGGLIRGGIGGLIFGPRLTGADQFVGCDELPGEYVGGEEPLRRSDPSASSPMRAPHPRRIGADLGEAFAADAPIPAA